MTLPEIKATMLIRMDRLGWTRAELSRQLGIAPNQVTRLLDPTYESQITGLMQALDVLGLELVARAKR